MARKTAVPASQLTLSLLDTSALTSSLTLDASGPRGRWMEPEEDAPPPATADERPPARPWRLAGERTLAPTWRGRAADNVAAIRLAQALRQQGRPATPDEQEILSRFVGFGASDLANSLFRRPGAAFRPGWEEMGQELERIASPVELAGLARATQYAHYTPEFIVHAVWRAVARLGFAGGAVLEPGCGTGLFLAAMPEAVRGRVAATAIENDPCTAAIAALLHPDAWVRAEDFTKARISERFELAIGNPPFSDRTVRADDPSGKLGLSLHDYFIARSVERLKPGGIAAFVTSRFTMDKRDASAREHIASMADLLGAFRLPEGAMRAAAGTDVVVDLLFFQRREAGTDGNGAAWAGLAEVQPEVMPEEDGSLVAVNRWFADHPDAVLGLHGRTSGPFGPTYTVHYCPTVSLPADLEAALLALPEGVHTPPSDPPAERAESARTLRVGTAAEGATVKEGSYLLLDGALVQVVDGVSVPVKVRTGRGGEGGAGKGSAGEAGGKPSGGIPPKHARILRALIPIRDWTRAVLRAQEANEPWEPAQTRLRVAYSTFRREFGPINLTAATTTRDPRTGEEREVVRRPNLAPFLDDPDCWLVSSIEHYDEETGAARMGPIFTERVIHPPTEPLIASAADALAVCLNEVGHVDPDRIAELLGHPRAEALAELGEAVFLEPSLTIAKRSPGGMSAELTGPEQEAWQTADAYLSGAIRTKLAVAEAAAALDPRYARNVAALRRVQPEDLRPSDITARLGTPWMPPEVVEAFSAEVIGIATHVRHTVEIAAWSVGLKPFEGKAEAMSEWGTARRHAGLLLSDALNSSLPQVWDTWIEDGKERRELNEGETEAAKEKQTKIKQAFEHWVWTDPARADRLARIYNDRFNNLVPRRFDGSHLRFPGMNRAITLRPHQKDAIWRIVASGSTYLAHVVGSGKTMVLSAAVMEQKRLGLVTKPMMPVPSHCLAQASREFLLLYPNARILVADEQNFAKDKRARFLARAATASWDCIIITHSAFKLIAAPAEFERGMVADQLAEYEELLMRVDEDDRLTRKRIEHAKEVLQAKLEALSSAKDDMLTIAEMGVDQILVDEGHQMRKLAFPTNLTGLKGVDPDGSQRAWDLYVKSRYVAQRRPRRALVLASGTPITNTLGEMFTVQRFLQPEALRARGIHQFDAWASTFGSTRTELELQPSGRYKPVTRFCEFVNVPELVAMFRSVADVVGKDELRAYVRLPSIRGGKREIVTAPASPAFRAYQRVLTRRIELIEEREGPPEPGDDILLSVITDGRHAAIDLRFVLGDKRDRWDGTVGELMAHARRLHEAETVAGQGNKLALLVRNVHRIWRETADRAYLQPDGTPSPVRGGTQMVFSDLGTEAAEETRGFSAYRWVKQELVRLGVPAGEIAFVQDYKKTTAKARLFQEMNAGRIRITLGSTPMMGTGANAQARLAALHHLDVPWLPADVEQREGRIERQGNGNEEIEIYAYATLGSVDATSWQLLERKARFIAAALAGDRSIRRLEDVSDQANQFALAKALASGDPRLMQKAGLEAEVARLRRLRAAHLDDQLALRREVANARGTIRESTARVEQIGQDLQRRLPTRGDAFAMELQGRVVRERRVAGNAVLVRIRALAKARETGSWSLAHIGGFDVRAEGRAWARMGNYHLDVWLDRTGHQQVVTIEEDLTAQGLITRLEYMLDRFDVELAEHRRRIEEATNRLAGYEPRVGAAFAFEAELDAKLAELEALDADLAKGGKGGPEEVADAA